MPRLKAHELRTQEIPLQQPKPRLMKGTGPAKDALSKTELDVQPSNRVDPEWAGNMAFAKELITIRVDESEDENAEKNVEVWNNGDLMVFPRGQDVTCERRFVETLMRAKPTKYSQKAVLDDLGKVGGYQEIPHRALRYHFQMVRDDNPLGAAWLKATLSQA